MANINKAGSSWRTAGLFSLHSILALLGPAFIESVINKFVRASSATEIVMRAWIVGILCAFLTALFMATALRSRTALWVWILPLCWFAVGVLGASSGYGQGVLRGSLTAHFSGLSCATTLDQKACRDFFAFTIPLVRSIAYSAGAFLSISMRRAPKPALSANIGAER